MFEVKCDYDYRKFPPVGKALFRLRFLGVRVCTARISRSTHCGWHIVFYCSGRCSNFGIIALQLLCGSDPNREMFNYARVLQLDRAPRYWKSKWNILYEAD